MMLLERGANRRTGRSPGGSRPAEFAGYGRFQRQEAPSAASIPVPGLAWFVQLPRWGTSPHSIWKL